MKKIDWDNIYWNTILVLCILTIIGIIVYKVTGEHPLWLMIKR